MCEYISGVITLKGDLRFGNLYSHAGIARGWGLQPDSYREFEWTKEGEMSLWVRGEEDEDTGYYKQVILSQYPTRSALLSALAGGEIEGRVGSTVVDLVAIVALGRKIDAFVASIENLQVLQPQEPEDWMIVQNYGSVDAMYSWKEAYMPARSARSRARSRARDRAYVAALNNHRNDACDRARDVAQVTASRVAYASMPGVCDIRVFSVPQEVGVAASLYALGLMVEDLGVDITWLYRWWRAWELGFTPFQEDRNKLVVGRVVEAV